MLNVLLYEKSSRQIYGNASLSLVTSKTSTKIFFFLKTFRSDFFFISRWILDYYRLPSQNIFCDTGISSFLILCMQDMNFNGIIFFGLGSLGGILFLNTYYIFSWWKRTSSQYFKEFTSRIIYSIFIMDQHWLVEIFHYVPAILWIYSLLYDVFFASCHYHFDTWKTKIQIIIVICISQLLWLTINAVQNELWI